MAQGEVIELLKNYIQLLRSEGISVSKAFLYGSYSNESATDQSDIDVLLVSDGFEESNDRLAGKVWRLTRQINSRIEPILMGTEKYEDSDKSPLLAKVKESGIQIV
ncbi:nucleotidyltransferase domain-containing protein [Algoriphagus sp. C2-6-M1]|uniref:nucleotidyltransferase domain-containing protein n=1 Tax=Algoriphagus persicinus TaxID=3108754 RepID=UPI002B36DA5D|nr:nucleotidyltransferase domain-containing protein [Algoriphagus sp. C2-6-M1]MEB2779044.1 nucleotidyltransferase domain-containing protein [Algoriphagus sp. C2-6-M1]